MNFPISIDSTSLFQILGIVGGVFPFYSKVYRIFCKQTRRADLAQPPQNAAPDQGLHCWPMSHKKDARLIWVKNRNFINLYIDVSQKCE